MTRSIYLILLLSIALVAWPHPLRAADIEPAWRKAQAGYDTLQSAPRKKKFRSEWEKVLDRFMAVYERDPKGPRAADALFMAGKTLAGLYRVSQVDDDAWSAVTMYEHVARDVPGSPLGDDALVLAAELLEGPLAAPEEAWLRYRRVLDQFPGGDKATHARRKLKTLAAYAPPPSPVAPANLPAPAVPAATAAAPVPAPGTANPPAALPALPVGVVAGAPAATGETRLSGIRFWSNPGYTRVVLDMSANAGYTTNFLGSDPIENLPPRLYLDITPATLDPVLKAPTIVDDGLLRRIRTGVPESGKVRVVLDLISIGQYKVFPLSDPYRLVIDISGDKTPELKALEPAIHAPPPIASDAPVKADVKPAEKPDEVARVLDQVPPPAPPPAVPSAPVLPGLRRIVVDAGHGGKDPGAIGPNGLQEKDVTLALAKKVARRLEEALGCDVVLTRDRDIFLPLEERTAIANKVGADLFISVHANAAPNRQAYGIETYYLNFSKNDKAAAVAARENGTSLKEVTDLEQILFDLMANSKINESSRLAAEIQRALIDRLNNRYEDVRDLGVRQGPFYVLLGATMPSVLVEAAFISHPREEQRLASRRYQEETAEAIAEAVKSYAQAHKLIASR
ncbi:MAG: AMIN domain-containing protein [Deltaproteobacteria bacterium]|nr:MAG: AMIN domain-containing protein [Deltaproteobacteria bacterium]